MRLGVKPEVSQREESTDEYSYFPPKQQLQWFHVKAPLPITAQILLQRSSALGRKSRNQGKVFVKVNLQPGDVSGERRVQ